MAGPEISKDDILQASDGMLQKQLYMYHTFPTDGLGPVMDNIGPHLEFQISLEKRGIMFGAGPFWDETEKYGKARVWSSSAPAPLPRPRKSPIPIPCMRAVRGNTRCAPG